MLMKNALAALLGLTLAAEAASVHHLRSPATGTVVRRQNKQNGGGNRGGNRNGGGGGGGGAAAGGGGGAAAGGGGAAAGGAAGGAGGNQNNNQGGGGGGDQASVTCLAANAVQTGSQQTGQNGQVADGQVEAAVDPANFINFCSGKDLTNGFQKRGGSCNGIVMGDIPSVENMVSTVILEPGNFQDLAVGQTFTIKANVAGINLGAFTNATSTYYSSPAALGQNGKIIGHTHVTVQDTGNSLNPQQPLDAKQFVFFKGINDAGNGQGLVQTDVTGGLPAGNYRVCTMSSAANHQPVLMPVAQRGSQEDCKYFTVGKGNGGAQDGGAQNGGAQNGGAQNGGAQNGGAQNGGAQDGGAQNGGGKGKGGGGKGAGGKANNAGAQNGGAQAAGGAAQNAGGGGGGAIGGIAAPAVEDTGDATRPFKVGDATFVNKAAAVQRACAIQNNACSDGVNRGQVQGSSLQACNAQEQACRAAA